MSIKYAVLGLIAEEPRHGYAVRAAFEQRLGDFWELNVGQVYQVLTALEGEGLIAGTDERVGRRPVRRIYSATAKGRDDLRRWLATPGPRRRPFRDEFYVRLLFALAGGFDASVRTMVTKEIQCGRERLAGLMDQVKPIAKLDAETCIPQVFTRAAILHSEADLKALEFCLTTLEQLKATAPNRPAREEVPGIVVTRLRRKAIG